MFLYGVVIVGKISDAKMKFSIWCPVVLHVSKYCTALLLHIWSPDSFYLMRRVYLVLQLAGETEEMALCPPAPLSLLDH